MIANRDGGDDLKPSEWTASRDGRASTPISRKIAWSRRSSDRRDWLLARQHEEGYWVAELEGDTILESEYVLLLAFLGLESNPSARGWRATSRITSFQTGAGRSIPAARRM